MAERVEIPTFEQWMKDAAEEAHNEITQKCGTFESYLVVPRGLSFADIIVRQIAAHAPAGDTPQACGMHGKLCTDATTHHFLKYHDHRSEFYIGSECVNCAFSVESAHAAHVRELVKAARKFIGVTPKIALENELLAALSHFEKE